MAGILWKLNGSDINLYVSYFPAVEQLQKLGVPVVVLGSLKKDIEVLKQIIQDCDAKQVVGIAKSKVFSRRELITINQFNRNKIDESAAEFYKLDLYPKVDFTISKNPGNTFCNWSIWQLYQWRKQMQLDFKLSFVHINENDISKLIL